MSCLLKLKDDSAWPADSLIGVNGLKGLFSEVSTAISRVDLLLVQRSVESPLFVEISDFLNSSWIFLQQQAQTDVEGSQPL